MLVLLAVGALLLSRPIRAEAPPHPARELLRSQAEAEDPRVRAHAISALIETGDDWAAWAARGRRDASPAVRRAALEAGARHLPDPEAMGLLFEALAHPEVDDLSACLSALPMAAEPAVASLAAARVRTARDPGAALPCLLLAARGGDEPAAAALAELLGQGRLRLDQALILELARQADPQLGPALAEGQERLPEEARLASLLIRAVQGEAAAARELRATLRGEDEDAAMEAVDLLHELASVAPASPPPASPPPASVAAPRAAELLRQAQRSTSDRVARYARLTRLSRGESAGRALREALADANGELLDLALACQARATTGELREGVAARTASRLLELAITSERERIWIQAAGLAARTPELAIEPALQTWLDSDEPLVQIAAARATLMRARAVPASAD